MSVFNVNSKNHLERKMFLDGEVDVQRYDVVKYPQFEKLTEKLNGFFWQPQEIDLIRDSKDFRDLTTNEKHIFISNLKRQILLDSVQGRSPNLAFLPICSLPELETWIQTWSFNETIHSRSYTHIIRNVFSDPSVIFDQITQLEPILACARDVSEYYDDLISATKIYEVSKGVGDRYLEDTNPITTHGLSEYDIKRKIWLAINSVNVLEGIRFYVSFACSWAFAEVKKMEGNAKIIKLICRDENLHLASSQTMLKLLPKDDSDFVKIERECRDEVVTMFESAINQEKTWAHYLFQNGSMIGLNEALLSQYVDWTAAKRMRSLGLDPTFKVPGSNPLPWTQKWISGSEVQEAPQEVSLTRYETGRVTMDVTDNTFSGFKL